MDPPLYFPPTSLCVIQGRIWEAKKSRRRNAPPSSSRESRPDTEVIVSGSPLLQLQLQQFCLPASPPLHPSCSRATGGKPPWPMIDAAFKIVAVSLFAMPRHVPFFAQRGGGPHGSSDRRRHSLGGSEPRRALPCVAVSRIYPSGQLQPIMYLQ